MGLYVENDGWDLAIFDWCPVVITGGVWELKYDFFPVVAVNRHAAKPFRAVEWIGALEDVLKGLMA